MRSFTTNVTQNVLSAQFYTNLKKFCSIEIGKV